MKRLDATIGNTPEELAPLLERAAAFIGEAALSPAAAFEAQLVIEEAVVNVIRYAFPGGERHDIVVRIEIGEREMRIEVIDDGVPFDPTRVPPADVTSPIESRPVGGLGIHLIRSMMDQVGYHRHDGHNHLTMAKTIPPEWRKDA